MSRYTYICGYCLKKIVYIQDIDFVYDNPNYIKREKENIITSKKNHFFACEFSDILRTYNET